MHEVVLAGAAAVGLDPEADVELEADEATSWPPKGASGLEALLTDVAAFLYAARVCDEDGLTTPDIPEMQWFKVFCEQ